MPHHSTTSPVLHPYVRISDPSQRKGGGLERQTTNDLKEFAERFGFTISKHIWVDDGVSAWRGLNATPNHELGKFIAEANRGTIQPGDCLLVENLDRLSRQDIWAATSLVNDLRQLKIHIGRLDRMKLLRYDSKDLGDFLESAVEFGRGNSESEAKSDRNGKAWARKREAARESGRTMTARLPAWVREVNGRREAIPERALVLKHIFALAAAGYGYVAILRRLNEEKVPPFGKNIVHEGRKRGAFAGHWTLPYLARLLNDRRVCGEYQPCGRRRKPEGPPIAGFYPVVITEEEYWLAQRARDGRKKAAPRQGKLANLFSGLLRNARNGETYIAASKRTRVLVSYGSQEGRSPAWSFPLPIFETAIRRQLKEIDAHSILNGDTGPDETIVLAGQLASVEAKIAEFEAQLLEGDVAALARVLRRLEDDKATLASRLAEARQKAAHPLSEAWGEMQSIPEELTEDQRIRYRAALRRIVDSIWLLVVPRGRDRICAAQVFFAPGKRVRHYLIHHRAAGNHRPGSWSVRSLATIHKGADFDLRRCENVREMEKWLATEDLEVLTAALEEERPMR
jgi:DNA invertase Pin-like site-specific DNA recombinase